MEKLWCKNLKHRVTDYNGRDINSCSRCNAVKSFNAPALFKTNGSNALAHEKGQNKRAKQNNTRSKLTRQIVWANTDEGRAFYRKELGRN